MPMCSLGSSRQQIGSYVGTLPGIHSLNVGQSRFRVRASEFVNDRANVLKQRRR
jgi:hypothetical protein